ncbi:hypothetical protein [Nannocystis exedens]|nr:hypothetical protein [Nannocystis exedens]
MLAACPARGSWTAALELLRAMPQDLNGGPQRGLAMLLKATDRDGFS